MANFDRLQFVKHEEIFANREAAYEYIFTNQYYGEYPDATIPMPALFGEPMVLLYESDNAEKGPNVILAIGSVGDGTGSMGNRIFLIDTQKTEEEIEELRELIEQAIKSLTIIPVDSETLDISAEKTDDGTFLSGDVKIADYTIASGKVQNNIIKVDGQFNRGLYSFVDMDYNPETFVITFNVNGETKEFQLPTDQHVVKGWYSTDDEAIYLKLADDSKVKIDVVKLIDEWTVLSSASTTPIMLFKEHVSSYTETHDGVYNWQDLLTADVRVADHINDNILHKDRTGKYLYVKGTADNIQYKNGLTVADALDNVDIRVSTSAGNMIYRRPDGLFASAMLDYNSAENKLVYRYTDTQTQEFKEVSFKLNSIKVLDDITYDPVREVIVIRYIDAQGEYQTVEIPAKDIIEEWIVNNEAHNIELAKYRSEGQGKDILSADAKIHVGDNNILEDKDHKLYVNGISDNIKYDVTGDTTVKNVLDNLSGETIEINAKLIAERDRATAAEQALGGRIDQEISDREADVDAEQARAEAAEEVLTNKIGSGFTNDPHENVTAKFETLSGKVDSEITRSITKDSELEAAIATETARATSAETTLGGRIDSIDAEIGDGFNSNNTVRDEIDNLQNEIDAVSADSASSLKDIINEDKSIEIDKTNPTKPVISTKISEYENNTIRLIQQEGSEGLFNFVDLTYDEVHNKLIFTRSTSDATDFTREIELRDIDVIKDIYYDPDKDVLVIIYKKGEGEGKIEIPLRGLIDEWDVYNDVHSAVELTKTWNSGLTENILSAEVKISAKEDNILENQEGELYVSNSAITENAAAIQAETARATAAESQLADDIAAEETRAETVEQTLSGDISNEIARAISAESILQANIVSEQSRAEAVENALSGDISSEIARATSAEQVLDNKIGSGFSDDVHENVTAKFETLSGKVDSEITRSTTKDSELEDAIAAETARATLAETTLGGRIGSIDAEIDNLQDEIDAISADSSSSIKDIINEDHSIDVDKTNSTEPVIKVNLSTEVEDGRKNIIKLNNDGLFANVDLDYYPNENKLVFHKTDGTPDKEIQLESMSSIISIEYNPTKEAIVITYMTNGHVVKTVEIPVGDLINEWRVEDGHPHAVQLEKVRIASGTSEQDVLKASVIITDDHDDNILVMDDGALYVSGAQIAANTAAIEAEIARATSAETTLQANIAAEQTRAEAVENALSGAISNEIARATNAESVLQTNIAAEQTRAETVENALSGAISNEITRATNEESELNAKINNEISRATTAESTLNSAIATENSRATAAEQALSGAISNEITRATSAESALQTNITTEQTRATSAETALQTAINTETSRAASAETRLEHLISDEADARTNSDSVITNNLNAEITRAESEENRILAALNNEISRATTAESTLNSAIAAEQSRATAAEQALSGAISNEITNRTVADESLLSRINQENLRAQASESSISQLLSSEINNRVTDVTNLTNALSSETQARQTKDAELQQMIENATLTFEDTSSVDFTKTTGNVVTAKVKVANATHNIILNPEGTAYEGLFASVRLDYDEVTNKIKLYVNGELQDEKVLSAGALLDNITYNSVTKSLVLTYTDANGNQHELNFPVDELFNGWHVENPLERSAIELTKTPPAQSGEDDVLSGRVIITDDRDGDGKPDSGSSNIIEIKNNGLFVDGSAMEEAKEVAECVQKEVKVFEKVVIGHQINEDCGSGYTYEPNNMAKYISAATSFNNADVTLDSHLNRVENYANDISAKTDCVDSKAEALYKMLYANNFPMPNCGSGVTYQPYAGACIISAATSFMEADQLLNDQICELFNMWVNGKTCTTESEWVDDGANKKMTVDVRLSRGNNAEQSDSDVIIESLNGSYIDPTRTEFTDTNALRIVCLTEGPGGTIPSIDSMQNGVYLSNAWDCGLYYDEATEASAIAAAQAAGYKTDNYRTDTNPDASNFNYMNNVRQSDIPHA